MAYNVIGISEVAKGNFVYAVLDAVGRFSFLVIGKIKISH